MERLDAALVEILRRIVGILINDPTVDIYLDELRNLLC